MERLTFEFQGGDVPEGSVPWVLVGVVSSGNLEVLMESADLAGSCRVEISTAVAGFAPVWQAVVGDFFERHRLADVRVSINDMGATPAVVSLRLEQAMAEFQGTHR